MKKQDISLLYVEDEKILRNIYQRILSSRVRDLYIAENGEDGLKLYKKHKPDLVITDIKMPVMNGLEMTKRIKRENRDSRIVIMSAYGQTQYFIQAIENGVSNFLLKPVDNNMLFSVIEDNAHEILLEKKVLEQAQRRRKAENALKRSEAILRAVSFASEQFLQENFGEKSIPPLLERLGKATNVSRVYLFENQTDKNGSIFSNQRYEWVQKGIASQQNNPGLQDFIYHKNGFGRWVSYLSKGKQLYGLVNSFPESEKEILLPQNIISIMVIPIFTDEYWWGFIGFDDCKEARLWTASEKQALSAAADILGAAIHRRNVEDEILKLNNELEKRVEERTRDLLKEINERSIAEMMLRESEEKYRQIFENANDGITLTMDGIVKFTNPKLYEMTGYLPKECIDKPFTEFIHPDYREMVLEYHIRRLQGEKVPERYDIKIFDKRSEEKWFELKSTLIKWEDSPAVLTFLTDITERKQTAEELKLLNEDLERRVKEELKKREQQQQLLIQKSKLESLGELSAGIAHELNQPLGGISMILDNIMIGLSNNKASKDYLEEKFKKIFEDIDRIRNIINHVRSFSKDQDIGELEKVSVTEVINNAVSMINTQYSNHNVDIVLDLQDDLYTYGSKFKLEQVLLNLFSNAKFAIDEKEALAGEKSYQKKIKVLTRSNEDKIYIDVEDNGTGIPEEKQINIFDPFFTTKRDEMGTGLGLSISYGIIKEMKGEIMVNSRPGEYTIMKIKLPAYKK